MRLILALERYGGLFFCVSQKTPDQNITMIRWILLAFLLSIVACRDTQTNPDKPGLWVVYATALREAPGEKSAELIQLEPGDPLTDLGQVSSFISGIILNDTLRNEPWLQVQTKSGRQGWVFAGALRPAGQDLKSVQQWALNKRFTAWFGLTLAQRWASWTQAPPPQSDSTAAVFFRQGLVLRDTLNLIISRRVTRDPEQPLPDLFWLGEMSPLFIVQQIAGGATYYLFTDYRVLTQMAAQTEGLQDDAFARVCTEVYPSDSIESVLPMWVFPVSAEAGCSNLGGGNHVKTLRSIDEALQAGDLFRPELLALKDRVLEDISDKNSTYWQPQDKILAEVGKVLKSDFKCLDDRDRISLEARQKMFEAYADNGIVLNLRSGK